MALSALPAQRGLSLAAGVPTTRTQHAAGHNGSTAARRPRRQPRDGPVPWPPRPLAVSGGKHAARPALPAGACAMRTTTRAKSASSCRCDSADAKQHRHLVVRWMTTPFSWTSSGRRCAATASLCVPAPCPSSLTVVDPARPRFACCAASGRRLMWRPCARCSREQTEVARSGSEAMLALKKQQTMRGFGDDSARRAEVDARGSEVRGSFKSASRWQLCVRAAEQ